MTAEAGPEPGTDQRDDDGSRADLIDADADPTPQWRTTAFVPGPHLGLVGPHLLGLVEAGDDVVRQDLWAMVAGGLGLDAVLERLAAGGLRTLPSFGLASVEGDRARVVARGDIELTIVKGGGDIRRIDPVDVSTWIEEVVTDVAELAIALKVDARADDATAHEFHLLAGCVPATWLRRVVGEDDSSAPAGRSRPTARPLPAQSASAANPDATVGPVSDGVVGSLASTGSIRPDAHDESRSPPTLPPPAMTASGAERDEVAADPGTAGDVTGAFDDLFGQTIARSVEDAAMRGPGEGDGERAMIDSVPARDAPGARDPSDLPAGEHDGLTVTRADLESAQHRRRKGGIVAAFCELQHANPPQRVSCRVCGRPVSGAPSTIDRPPLAILAFSTGERVLVDRTILIGRNPKVVGTVTGEMPRLVKVDDARDGLSRTHAEVRIEGWQMLLEDLRSTNGTEVRLPGQPARQLHAGEPIVISPGTFIDFGEELQCSVEEVESER